MASYQQVGRASSFEFAWVYSKLPTSHSLPLLISLPNSRTLMEKPWKLMKSPFPSSCSQSPLNDDTHWPPPQNRETLGSNSCSNPHGNIPRKERVFFLDVNPLCYKGSTPSLRSFAHWISLFFSRVSLNEPVIAVLDGERGNDYRRQLLPSYKMNRRKTKRRLHAAESIPRRGHHKHVLDFLHKCNVPVVKVDEHEADDVVASLVQQVLVKGYRAVIASPDKDFKQLISEDVQMVIPVQELDRWSFYTLKHYIAQYNCDPECDLSLRCLLGDEIDGVPGIQHLAPGFGRKTALKLLKKHGSLENLLSAVSVRTVGRQYAQDALTKHADFLRRNYDVLSLKRDVNVQIEEQWLARRDGRNDSVILSNFMDLLSKAQDLKCL
ncbi:uncharacterized protein LOC127256978 [Andrographis paniculata]|uniref:uncharacterized protein LOC127256978 n=1 Tax=Andrographis paniculata TaxID=175694 RepID=UPI0021E90487|nr:uncharacterized protein LOC127256978 [Andrographis paniculata]XP_051139178.1 uncharacterized protein LOC127256978 [Andrographis paniculata]